jgi:hypothetical protein
MFIKRLIIGSFLTLGVSSFAVAQRGQVSIDQEPGIGRLLEIYEKSISGAGYYTIQVGFVRQDDQARELKDEVEIEFPQWRANIIFDSPTYRVQIGRFKDRLEAEREYLEVRKKYPGALLLRPETRKSKKENRD